MKELNLIVKKTNPESIRPLRHLVLRPGKPFSSTKYKKDVEKNTIHIVCEHKKKIITCATFYPEKTEKNFSKNPYRLRGMATHPKYRRRGGAKKVMNYSFLLLKKKKCDFLWCKARLVAVEFYESIGFKKEGEIFNIEGIGPHYYMYKII